MNSQLIKMEALQHGYIEEIALNTYGFVSEGSGENIFIVKNNKLHTPPLSAPILPGITRDSITTLRREMGLEVVEEMIPREILYIADEVFFTGTAAEITPTYYIDRTEVEVGKREAVTKKFQQKFFGIISGEKEERHR
jgi:branched-chain amino acid aminotransferase